MKTSYFSCGFLVGVAVASMLFSLLRPGTDSARAAVTRLKVAHSLPTNHPVHAGIEHFAERVAALSGSRLQLDIFPNGQLGNEDQTLEQIQAGSLDVAKVGGATLGSFIPVAKIFSLPFLFRDSVHYWAVLSSEIGHDLLTELATTGAGQASGFRGLTYYDAGSRNFYTKKPILSPDDLRGLKIRVMNDPVAIDTMKAMGASATPISWGELYTALQQGVVDGAENNPPSFISSRHFEVCKEFSMTQHTRIPDVLVISEKTWGTLSPQEREWVQQAATESSAFQRKAWEVGEQEALAQMTKAGVTIHEVEIEPFVRATESVRTRYSTGPILDYVNRIENVKAP